ncbi:hypothetical protein MASR1M36_22960 [Candidatus Cloacimonadaceae bacterium]
MSLLTNSISVSCKSMDESKIYGIPSVWMCFGFAKIVIMGDEKPYELKEK